MRTWTEECKVAESLRVHPPSFVRRGRRCQQASRTIVGASAWGDSALEAWHAIPDAHKVHGRYVEGGISYWDDIKRTGEAGHAAWNFTKGRVYSTDILVFGRMSVVPYTYIHEKWGMRYLGTILWTPSGNIALPPQKPAPVVSPWSKGDVYLSKLHHGQTNSDSVKRLQYKMRALGYVHVSITGNYDNNTDLAVRTWQQRVGHKPDPVGKSFIGPVEFKMLFPSPPYTRHY